MVGGLSGLINRATNLNLLFGFIVGFSNLEVSHLQYVDDTLIFVKPSVEALWTIKAILRVFELSLGLGVNFHKSSLIRINVEPYFLQQVEEFLHCKIESLPFRYLQLPVGANPISESTWELLLNLVRKRFNSWSHRYVSS